jgi:ATP-dependent DNA helicase DinG
MVPATDRIRPGVLVEMRQRIEETGGNEVLFVCKLDREGLVVELEVVARGHEGAVPAPEPHVERGDVVVHNHPSGTLRPSDADIQTASALGSSGVGFYIVNNSADRLYVITEPIQVQEVEPLDAVSLAGLVRDGGKLSEMNPTFEERQSQVDMLADVVDAFNESLICAAEAGTGVGKSFAYLIPAFAWAAQNGERVVISTATINLQQQLVDKDIPVVKRLLGSEVKAVLLKGRSHYLCPNRLEEAVEEDALFEENDSDLAAIRDWAAETSTGSRSDLPFHPTEEVWSRVNSDPDSCSGLRCRRRGDCFLLKARKEAAGAGIIVVNHHLLFSDLALRLRGMGFDNTAVLPPFQRIVFDEAHSVEDSATSYFSESFSRLGILKHTGRLLRHRRGRPLGLLLRLGSAYTERQGEVQKSIDAVREQAQTLDSLTAALLGSESSYRLVAGEGQSERSELLSAVAELHSRVLTLVERLNDVIAEYADETAAEESGPLVEVKSVVRRLETIAGLCESFRRFDEDEESVYWIEQRSTGSQELFHRFTKTPLHIGTVMQESVYEPYETVVFTSATITVNEQFTYWAGRVGLDQVEDSRQMRQSYPSPFPFAERVLLGVPTDAPPPQSGGYQRYLERFVVDALSRSRGRALVLFTAYSMLRQTYDYVKPYLQEQGISCLRQGDDERSRLLSHFTNDTASVLFATDSFWQGVDAPGDTLRLVILCRLPFRVPTHPVALARMDALEREGGNPFMDLSLPEAVTKLKQGFGRLMRHKNDLGAVLITDVRMVTKRYGEVFVHSLPETRRSFTESAQLLEALESFLEKD